jgi:Uma2 family endonuclease
MATQLDERTRVADATRTFADVIHALGDIDPARILLDPQPGTATLADAERLECELVDGTLVKKAMGLDASYLTTFILEFLAAYVRKRNLGLVSPPDGFYRFFPEGSRAPDIAYVAWASCPDGKRPRKAVDGLVPDLCIEVISPGNTKNEMARKRGEYFASGVKFVWEINPETKSVIVYTMDDAGTSVKPAESIEGGSVIPGFSLSVAELFGELEREADSVPETPVAP